MTIQVSQEVYWPQECSQLSQITYRNILSDKNWKIPLTYIYLCIFYNFLCIFQMQFRIGRWALPYNRGGKYHSFLTIHSWPIPLDQSYLTIHSWPVNLDLSIFTYYFWFVPLDLLLRWTFHSWHRLFTCTLVLSLLTFFSCLVTVDM